MKCTKTVCFQILLICGAYPHIKSIARQAYSLSPRRERQRMGTETYRLLARTLNSWYPDQPVHCQSEHPSNARSIPLDQLATFYDYIIYKRRRHYASRAVGSNRSSLIEVYLADAPGQSNCGELLNIFDNTLYNHSVPKLFGRVRWFKEWTGPREDIWASL
jgi:hypothetical protein